MTFVSRVNSVLKMDAIQISAKLRETTYAINVLFEDECISSGSGVAVNRLGDILTAAHVVTGRLPIRAEDLRDPKVRIIARRATEFFAEYEPIGCGIEFHSEYFRDPIIIDFALLRAKSPGRDVPYLPISEKVPQVGTRVLMAGFPDDMEPPFSFDRKLDLQNREIQEKYSLALPLTAH
jgi:hypothetical protein